ncbi:MAG: hypothetical protein ACX93N_06860 [Pseudohaliea sp.]
MATTRDTFLTFGELLEELAGNSRRALSALEHREHGSPGQAGGDRYSSLVDWACERQRYLVEGLEGLAERGSPALLERYLQYLPELGPGPSAADREAVFNWTLDANNLALEVLSDLQHKTLAPEVEATIADLVRQLDAINRKIAMALNTAGDV